MIHGAGPLNSLKLDDRLTVCVLFFCEAILGAAFTAAICGLPLTWVTSILALAIILAAGNGCGAALPQF